MNSTPPTLNSKPNIHASNEIKTCYLTDFNRRKDQPPPPNKKHEQLGNQNQYEMHETTLCDKVD